MLMTMLTADEERLDRFPWNVQHSGQPGGWGGCHESCGIIQSM